MGVLGVMIAYSIFQKLFKVDLAQEQEDLQKDYPVSMKILRKSIKITQPSIESKILREMFNQYHHRLVFGVQIF